jgi:hypothetical protein
MNTRTIASITILIAILTILISVIASESAQYTNPIQTLDGVTMITTDDGDQVYTDVEYISSHVVSVKPVAINTIAPITLPNTSAPHGTITCDMGTYTVTTDQSCDNLQ